jgi:phytoene/squalene synthetase
VVSAVPVQPGLPVDAGIPSRPAGSPPDVRLDRFTADADPLPTGAGLLAPWQRRRLRTLYDYVGLVRSVPDRPAVLQADLLDALEDDLDRKHPRNPTIARTRRLAKSRGLPTTWLHQLISAARQDRLITHYSCFDDLLGYCRLSGSPLAQLTLGALGDDDPGNGDLAATVGSAARLLDLSSRVCVDADRGRVYLPQDELSTRRLRDDELTARPALAATRAAVEAQAHRAYYLLASAAPRLADLSWPARIALTGMVTDALTLHHAMRAERYDTTGWPFVPPRPDRIRAFATGLTRPHRLAGFAD